MNNNWLIVTAFTYRLSNIFDTLFNGFKYNPIVTSFIFNSKLSCILEVSMTNWIKNNCIILKLIYNIKNIKHRSVFQIPKCPQFNSIQTKLPNVTFAKVTLAYNMQYVQYFNKQWCCQWIKYFEFKLYLQIEITM